MVLTRKDYMLIVLLVMSQFIILYSLLQLYLAIYEKKDICRCEQDLDMYFP